MVEYLLVKTSCLVSARGSELKEPAIPRHQASLPTGIGHIIVLPVSREPLYTTVRIVEEGICFLTISNQNKLVCIDLQRKKNAF